MLSFLTSVATLYLAFIPELLYMEKTKVERDFPECSATAAAAGNVTLGICQRKVSARCFLLLLKAPVLVQFFLPPLFSYCVLENSSRLLFPYCPHLLDTSKGTKEEKNGGAAECICLPKQCTKCLSSTASNSLRPIGHNEKSFLLSTPNMMEHYYFRIMDSSRNVNRSSGLMMICLDISSPRFGSVEQSFGSDRSLSIIEPDYGSWGCAHILHQSKQQHLAFS